MFERFKAWLARQLYATKMIAARSGSTRATALNDHENLMERSRKAVHEGCRPASADRPSWKRRRAQPLVIDGVSVSRMILEERTSGN
jgi:hypothetical protein